MKRVAKSGESNGTMEVKSSVTGRMASSSSGNFPNKENPWDFIEKEILEFQSIVKELEEYSTKAKSEFATFKNPEQKKSLF